MALSQHSMSLLKIDDEEMRVTIKEREFIARLLDVAVRIARGRHDCGRPLAAEAARQLARDALTKLGEDWRLPAGS